MLIDPLIAAPVVGDVIATAGGVRSLKTVTLTGDEFHNTPKPSRATAVSVCDPLVAVFVFHWIEYGAVVSSAPMLTPSSLNCTPATVSMPTMVTFALTGTVADTVDPDAGDVIITTRLPSCAASGVVSSQTRARVIGRESSRRVVTMDPYES